MKSKGLIIGVLIAILFIGAMQEASAHRSGGRRGYGYGRGYGYRHRAPRVWIAPPPPPHVVIGPRYGYHHRYYSARPRYHRGYGRHYGYRRW